MFFFVAYASCKRSKQSEEEIPSNLLLNSYTYIPDLIENCGEQPKDLHINIFYILCGLKIFILKLC